MREEPSKELLVLVKWLILLVIPAFRQAQDELRQGSSFLLLFILFVITKQMIICCCNLYAVSSEWADSHALSLWGPRALGGRNNLFNFSSN